MMNSRRICPADGSQYKDSTVGLVFMESAAGLAMETSKVESAVRNQAEAKMNQLEHTDVDVNASQFSCSTRRIRRRLVSTRSFSRWLVLSKVLLLVLLTSVERRRLSKWQRRVLMLLLVSAGGSALRGFVCCCWMTSSWYLESRILSDVAFTRVFGISISVIVLSLRYGFELVLRRGHGLDELWRGRAVIPHSHLPAGIVATMRRVVNYHSSWARQHQVELFDASGNPGSTAGRGFNPAGGAPGGG
ncbi:hypothetical protein F511_31090 [Dorcoceras hygrometricum]|uniref:Uncharacterized protein n=1 Tax=Dorcoceras hygrometricum TaxID=472368 RepID=A0A2Z7A9G3_9LAMI|nr:hypothetical protein F511_31090 [Dorcoceras hygrometricum]